MDQHVSIEDVVIPFRTYAWALTGSISQADQLMIRCFEGIAKAPPETLPKTKKEWFDYIDNAVIGWVSGQKDEPPVDHILVAQSIKAVADTEPDSLYRLLTSSMDLENNSWGILSTSA